MSKLNGFLQQEFTRLLSKRPRVVHYPQWDTSGERNGLRLDGIKTLSYDGADYQGKRTKVFAHMGYPENLEKPVPAVVLVHGGGGHPEDVWIKKWNLRGYAAISMDTTGFFPTKPVPYLCEGVREGLERRLCDPFAEDGYAVGPDNPRMADLDLPVEEQWLYHAVTAVILAHNILREDPRVDSEKIGICGISWGSVIASVAIGYDPRFRFAVPIYGSGYLGCGHTAITDIFKRPGAQLWFAEKRFSQVKIPVMWLCWNDDFCFSVNSNSMSYLETRDNNPNTCLSMRHEMRHSHQAGYTPEESYWFADQILKHKPVPRISVCYEQNRVHYSCSAEAKRIRLFYITERMSYTRREKYGLPCNTFMKQDWQITELDPENGDAPLPENAVGKYVEFTLANGVVLTSPYVE